MTGSEHYPETQRLLEHPAGILDTRRPPRRSRRARRAPGCHRRHGHRARGAAVAGLSAHLDTADTQAWRRVAGTRLGT